MNTRQDRRGAARLLAMAWVPLLAASAVHARAQDSGPAPSSPRLPIETALTPAGPASAEDAAAPSAGTPQTAASTAEFRRLLDTKEYEQAVALARAQVAAVEPQPGPGGEYLQVALMNLGLAQYLGADYLGAEASFLRVIELVEATGRLSSPRLARAQAGLATTYYAARRYDLAVDHYEKAIALVRREHGLFTEEQLPYLEKYANALTELGRYDDANRTHRYMLHAIERKHGSSSVRYAQELESYGRWLTRIGSYDASRALLRRSVEIIEDAKGENAAELIGPLTALGECSRRQLLDPGAMTPASPDQQKQSMMGGPMAAMTPALSSNSVASEGQKSLERAVAVATTISPPSPAQVADTRTLLGDWYQSRQQTEKAVSNYELAWLAASGTSVGGEPLTGLLFGRPVLIAYQPPSSWNRYANRPSDEVVVRNARTSFTVSARGRVVQPRVLEDAGDARRGAMAQRAVSGAVYRPRFEKGVAVDTPDVTLDQPFWVLTEDEAKPEEPQPSPEPGAQGG